MEKKTLLALAALIVLGAGAYGVMHAPEKGQRVGPPPRPVAEIKAADIHTVELTNGPKKETVAIEKRDGGWFLTKPTEFRADQSAVKQLTDGLEKMSFADTVTEGTEKHEEMGVTEASATRVTAKDKSGKVLCDLLVGKSVGGFTMSRPADKNQVWQTSGIFPYLFNRDSKAWRDHIVFEFPQADADKLAIESAGHKLVLERAVSAPAPDGGAPSASDTKWKITEATGDAPKTTEVLDQAMATGALQSLAALRANDFAEDKAQAETGLDQPGITVTATVKGKPYVLLIGKTGVDDIYVKRADAPTVYSFKRYGLDRLNHPPIDYRDKTIVKAKDSDIASIDLVVGGETLAIRPDAEGAWKAQSKTPLDADKLKGVASAFENLAGSSFATEKDAAKLGFAKPAGQATLKLKDKSTVIIKVGGQTKDAGEYYVQKAGNPQVLQVKRYIVDRFLKKAKDLEPSKGPPPGMPGHGGMGGGGVPPGMMPPGMPPH